MHVIAAGFFIGAFFLPFFTHIPSTLLLLCLFMILFVAYLLSYWLGFFKKLINFSLIKPLFIFILSAVMSLFYASTTAQSILDTRLQSQLEGKDLIVEGVVSNIPQHQQNRWRFYLDVTQVKLAQVAIDSEIIQLSGKIKLSWYHQKKLPQQKLQAGQKWRFKVRLKQPNGFMNEGGLDYEKWLFTNRIKATGYIRRSESNVLLDVAPWYSIHYQRQQLASKIKQSLADGLTNARDQNVSAIITALAVASRHDMTESQWLLFRQTGTSHLIAISGLHIGIVAGFGYLLIMTVWWLFPALYQRVPVRIAGAFLAVILATLYALLAGFTLPTQRSLVMVIGVVIVLLQRQRVDTINIFSMTLIVILLIDPLAAMSASFWLSFTAVILILLFTRRQLKKPRFSLVSLQLMLSFGMFPLAIFFFGSASLISPIANLIAIPWVTIFIVPLILLAMLLFFIAPVLSGYLLQFIAFNIDYLMRVLAWLDALPFTMLHFQELPTSLILVMMLSLLFLFLPKGFPARWLGVLLLIPVFSYQPQRVEQGAFKYSLLDIGQGLASLIETKNHTLIYDTGPRTNNRFDTGKLVVLPFLQSKGIKQIDKMVLSHEDMDHRGGTLAILKEVTVNEIISSRDFLIKQSIKKCEAGQTWQWDDVMFEFLHPNKQGKFSGTGVSDNNRSCVLRVSNQYHSLLLTGDIEKKVEQALLKTQVDKLASDVLLIPHHGSKTSSSLDFIKAVSPRLGLNSSGYRNKFKHPAKKIMQRYQDMGIPVVDTVDKGEMILLFPADKKPFKFQSYREEHLKFWHRR